MSKKTKAFLYNLVGFVAFYIPTLFIAKYFFKLEGFYASLAGFVVALILSPKFQYMKTGNGDKIFMKWILKKGIKEIE